MSLLFDENLSRKLVSRLADIFPGAEHVQLAGLESADDEAIREYATAHGLAIVSKDADFRAHARLRGAPPKTIHLEVGNCSTADVEALLRETVETTLRFLASDDSLLVLRRGRRDA